MAGYGGNGMGSSLVVLLALAPMLLAARLPAVPAPDPKPAAGGKALNVTQVTQTLDALVDAQRSLAASLSQVHDQLNNLQRGLNDLQGGRTELRDTVQQNQDALQGALDQLLDQLKEMREEVRGLYVESSGVKSDVAQVGKQVETLDQSLGGFRLSSGVVVAVLIVLQVVLVGLMFRARS